MYQCNWKLNNIFSVFYLIFIFNFSIHLLYMAKILISAGLYVCFTFNVFSQTRLKDDVNVWDLRSKYKDVSTMATKSSVFISFNRASSSEDSIQLYVTQK